MPKVELRNMEKRHRIWFASLRVPEDCVPAFGKSVLRKTTGETDPIRAAYKVQRIVAGWKEQIAAVRQSRREAVRAAILDRAYLPERVAKRLLEEQGLRVGFHDHVDAWAASLGMKQRQRDQYARDVRLFGEGLTIDEAATSGAAWVQARLAAGDSPETVQRRLAAVRGYWRWLVEHGHAHGDPLRDVKAPKTTGKRGAAVAGKTRRDAFTPADVARLHREAEDMGDQPLADLIWLAAHTGGRIEELCQLSVADVDMQASGTLRACLRRGFRRGERRDSWGVGLEEDTRCDGAAEPARPT